MRLSLQTYDQSFKPRPVVRLGLNVWLEELSEEKRSMRLATAYKVAISSCIAHDLRFQRVDKKVMPILKNCKSS